MDLNRCNQASFLSLFFPLWAAARWADWIRLQLEWPLFNSLAVVYNCRSSDRAPSEHSSPPSLFKRSITTGLHMWYIVSWFILPPLGSLNRDPEFRTRTRIDKFGILSGGDEWGNDGGPRMVR
ncbi:hypothetical protein Gotri_022179 [Gossypium trilobum]|uniref:Uncharacterized protein n=1 Tax=Gossypium trilobum TaxID=34281 RepID=A0A7J9DEW7_9ROSI|nr:hypothetical protein [Gossypium trilobum]